MAWAQTEPERMQLTSEAVARVAKESAASELVAVLVRAADGELDGAQQIARETLNKLVLMAKDPVAKELLDATLRSKVMLAPFSRTPK